MNGDSSKLIAWLREIGALLSIFELYERPGEFELDYSGASLSEVGAIAADRATGADTDLGRAITGYVGETLLRLTGGRWDWLDDEPVIRPDDVLGLAPLAPGRLVAEAIQAGDADTFTRVYEAWRDVVDQYRASHPQWTPVRPYTPGLDPVPTTEAEQDQLATWLVAREAAFPSWAERYAESGPWDFSPASLDRLAELLATRLSTTAELRDPTNEEFVASAVWYFGETLRRIDDAEWVFRQPEDPRRPGMYEGRPYVRRPEPDGLAVVPILGIQDVVRDRNLGALRARYALWTK